MVAPRKYRNAEERLAICNNVESKLQQLPLTEEENKAVIDVLAKFADQTGGSTLQGSIELNSINSTFQYVLPGRRIIHEMVRLVPQQKNENSSHIEQV